VLLLSADAVLSRSLPWWHHAKEGMTPWQVGRGTAGLMSLVRKYPLSAFFVLAVALSWWPWILYSLDPAPFPIVGFGPFLAALIVLAITEGKRGVVGLLRRIVRWRVGLQWYAVALLLPVVVTLAAAALNVFFLGAQRTSSAADLAAGRILCRRSSSGCSSLASLALGRSRASEAIPPPAASPTLGTPRQLDPSGAVGILAHAVRGDRRGHLD
jgi:hypothetical protein